MKVGDNTVKAKVLLWMRLHKELLLIRLREECCYSGVTLEDVKDMVQ